MDDKQKQDKVDRERLSYMFQALDIGSFGRLYFVPEDIWINGLRGNYSAKSTRKGHPGCSVCREYMTSMDAVPLLHGRSLKQSGCVAVENVMGHEKAT